MDREERYVYFDSFTPCEPLGDHTEKLILSKLFDIKKQIDTEIPSGWIPIPSICLDGHIYESQRVLNYREINSDEPFPQNMDICRDFPRIMNTILLGEYKKDTHKIVIYYNAIKRYSDESGLNTDDKIISTLACYMFEAMIYQMAKRNHIESVWGNRDGANGTKKEKEILRVVIPEFYEYYYCTQIELGLHNIAYELEQNWRRYFYSDWPSAQTLYFLMDCHARRMLSIHEARNKHWSVWNTAISCYYVSVSLKVLYA